MRMLDGRHQRQNDQNDASSTAGSKQPLTIQSVQSGPREATTTATEPLGSSQLLAGYLAHKFLTKGTLFGEMSSPTNLDDDDPDMEFRDLGKDPASAGFDGNSVEGRATASKSPSSDTGKVRVSGEQPASAGNVRLLPKKRATASKSPSSGTARQKTRVLKDRHFSAGKARVPSEYVSNFPVTTSESLSSFAGERASTEKVTVLENQPSGAATGGESTRLPPPWISGSEQWGGGKWKDDARKKKKMDEKSDIIPLKEVIEAVIRNSGETQEEDVMIENLSYVEILKSIGVKFPE